MKRSEIIEKWITALESGKYRQGNSYLVSENGYGNRDFCCLGVLCDVMGLDTEKLYQDMETGLPDKVAKKMGITNLAALSTPIQYRGSRFDDLARLNDSGVRFKTIARIIREQLAAKNFEKPDF